MAVTQIAPLFLDPAKLNVTLAEAVATMEHNLDTFEAMAQNASALGAEFILFPEDALYGFLSCRRSQTFPYLERLPNNADLGRPLPERGIQ